MTSAERKRILRLASRDNGVAQGYVSSQVLWDLVDDGLVSKEGQRFYCTAEGLVTCETYNYEKADHIAKQHSGLNRSFEAVTPRELDYLESITHGRRVLVKPETRVAVGMLWGRGFVTVGESFDKRDGRNRQQVSINNKGRRALKWSKRVS